MADHLASVVGRAAAASGTWCQWFTHADQLRQRLHELELLRQQVLVRMQAKERQRLQLSIDVEGLETLRADSKLQYTRLCDSRSQHELDAFLLREYTPPNDTTV
jgi:hypothetical protein